MTRHSRRKFLYSTGAGSVTLASLAPTTEPGILGWEPPEDAVPHSEDRYGWIIPVEGDDEAERAKNLDALESDFTNYDADIDVLSNRRHDAAGTLTTVAPVDVIGARNRDRWLSKSGIAQNDYIDESGIEINRRVTLANPIRPAGESAWQDFGALESTILSALGSGVPQPDGVAFDSDMAGGVMQDAREATDATNTETTLPDTSNMTVAVEDTGVTDEAYLDDADGNTRLRSDSKNFVSSGDPTGIDAVADDNGHGDWCTACYVARMPNDPSLEGFAPAAGVLGIKALDGDGGGQLTDIAAGIRHAADVGGEGTILNLSLGSPQFSQAIENALEYAVGKGVIPIAAAGNDRQGTRLVSYPASSQYTIAVGATTVAPPSEALSAYYSNTAPHNGVSDGSDGVTQGADIDVGAPGCKLEAAGAGAKTGTSMAGPVTGGVTTLYVSETGETDLETIREELRRTAEPAPKAAVEEVGVGIPNAANLLAGTEPEQDQADAETDEAAARGQAYETMSGSWLFRQVS